MINQVTVVGRLTKDPVLKHTKDQKPVINVMIAVNRPFKNAATGQYEADFVLCTLWGKQAENTAKFCQKGMMVGVIGRIQSRFFENAEGKRVYMTEIFGDSIQFLSKKQPSTERSADSNSTEPIPVRSLAEMK